MNAQGGSNQQRPSGAYNRIGPVGSREQSDDVDGGGWTLEFVQCLILSWKRTRRLPGASCAKVGDFRGFEVWVRSNLGVRFLEQIRMIGERRLEPWARADFFQAKLFVLLVAFQKTTVIKSPNIPPALRLLDPVKFHNSRLFVLLFCTITTFGTR